MKSGEWKKAGTTTEKPRIRPHWVGKKPIMQHVNMILTTKSHMIANFEIANFKNTNPETANFETANFESANF